MSDRFHKTSKTSTQESTKMLQNELQDGPKYSKMSSKMVQDVSSGNRNKPRSSQMQSRWLQARRGGGATKTTSQNHPKISPRRIREGLKRLLFDVEGSVRCWNVLASMLVSFEKPVGPEHRSQLDLKIYQK